MPTPENTCLPTAGAGQRKDATELCPSAADAKSCPDGSCQQDLLQQYTQLKDRFLRCTNALAAAAHDLKTPLSILSGYIELLQDEKLGQLSEKQRPVVRDMRISSARLEHLIQDFLTFSVLETGELRMKFEMGDMNACLSEVSGFWSQRFQEKGVALYFVTNDKLQTFVFD